MTGKPARPARRTALAVIVCVIAGVYTAACAADPSKDWPRGTLAEAGFSPDLGERIDAEVGSGQLMNLHAVLIARGGKLVLEQYYDGEDERWGRSLGTRKFAADDLHDLRSVTKSIVGLLYGIALADGIAPPLDAPLVDQFPEYPDLATDPQRRRMTVAHALSMKLGTAWNERLSYMDPRNSEHAMELAQDRYRFVLDRPMVAEPGTQWVYNGGATAVLGRLIAKGSGQSLRAFAKERLFEPLGIGDFEWIRGGDGAYVAASGLRMRPRDLAKIGQLVLNDGRWNGVQIVPADWLKQSFETQAEVRRIFYGFQWWLGPTTADGQRWVAGFGNGGQRLFILPRRNLTVLVMAGNYNQRGAWKLADRILSEIVFPGLNDK